MSASSIAAGLAKTLPEASLLTPGELLRLVAAVIAALPDLDGTSPADAKRYQWLVRNGELSLKRIASYGQKWAELRFPWVGDPFADRHKTLTEAIDAAILAKGGDQ